MSPALGMAALAAALAPLLLLILVGEAWGGPASPLGALLVGIAAALLATSLGTAAGLGLRSRFGGRGVFLALIALPPLLPPVLAGAALRHLVAETVLELPAAALWHALVAAPHVAALVIGALERIDPALHRAAWACGAAPDLVARTIERPRFRAAVAAGAALSLALSLGESTVAALLDTGAPAVTAPALVLLPIVALLGVALRSRAWGGTEAAEDAGSPGNRPDGEGLIPWARRRAPIREPAP